MNKILPSEETFEIADPAKLEKYENKSSENGHPYKKSHLAISILLLCYFSFRSFIWIHPLLYSPMLIVSRQYNQIEVLISCVGVCIALVNIFLGRLFQTSFKYKLNALNFLLIPCLALLLWTEISKLFYDICIDYPFDRRPQCKSEKMLFLPLALYSFSGLLLSAASFRVSLVISAYFQKIEDKEQAELLRESDGSQNLSKAEVLDIPENSI